MSAAVGVIFIVVFACVVLSVLVLFALVIRGIVTPPGAARLAAMERTGRTFVDGMTPKLEPWDSGSLTRLAGIRGHETLGFDPKAMFAWTWYGWVRSSATDAPLAAFALYRRAGVTQVIARTSRDDWRMVGEGGHGARAALVEAAFYFQGELLGRWIVTDPGSSALRRDLLTRAHPDGRLIDAAGRIVGVAQRPSESEGVASVRTTYDVTVAGEVAARIHLSHGGFPFKVQSDEPLVELVHPDLLDQRWLFSIAMTESAYFAVMRIRRGARIA